MSYYTPDVYNQPEQFGLTIIATGDTGGAYEFDMFLVLQDAEGKLYWATDSGCSCPVPFEDFTSVEDLDTGTEADLRNALIEWGGAGHAEEADEVWLAVIER